MAKFIIEIPEGKTQCINCPLCYGDSSALELCNKVDCDNLDLTKMIIKKIE